MSRTNSELPNDIFALIVVAVARSRASSIFGFFVMAVPGLDPGIDPAIREKAESRNQGIDSIAEI
jgi:hypothetical protein